MGILKERDEGMSNNHCSLGRGSTEKNLEENSSGLQGEKSAYGEVITASAVG